MKKKEIHDIVPRSSLKSIRNIPIPEREKREEEKNKERSIEIPIRKIETPTRATRKRNIYIWIAAILSIAVVFLVITAAFGKATVNIVSKTMSFDAPQSILAKKNPTAGEIGYSVVTLSESQNEFLAGTSQEQVSSKATGTITVYNNTASSQTLVHNTRFATSDGLVFRIDNAITIPSRTSKNGTAIPGSVNVDVTASSAGSSYNVGLTDFNVVAFQGTAEYTQVYGRSKTPISGGATGTVAVVDDTLINSSFSNLNQKVANDLVNKVSKQLPANFVIPDGAYSVEFSTSTPALTSTGATVTATGTITAYALDAKTILDVVSSSTGGSTLGTDNIKVLTSSLKSISFNEASSTLSINLSGSLTVEASIDKSDVLKTIEGQSTSDALHAIQNMPGVSSVEILLSPFWKFKLPNNDSNITLNIK